MVNITISAFWFFTVLYLIYSLISWYFVSQGKDEHLGRNIIFLVLWCLSSLVYVGYFILKVIDFLHSHVSIHLT